MCGVVGIHGASQAALKAVTSLFAQQHRGQNGAGIVSAQDGIHTLHRGLGMVKEIFNPTALDSLGGQSAIGHVRYPTQGPVTLANTQPHLVEGEGHPPVALAGNGDLVNYHSLRLRLEKKGLQFSGQNDGELLARFLAMELGEGKTLPEAVRQLMEEIKGAYSVVALVGDNLIAFRDPWGIRPLSMAPLPKGGYVVSSESVGVDIHVTDEIHEVSPGSLVVFGKGNPQQFDLEPDAPKHHCIFELIYFARPDGDQFGEGVYAFRKGLGASLAAKDDALETDVVIAVPDSSNVIALGYAEARNLPFGFGLMRNHYVGRTFIAPDQSIRDEKVKEKFNPVPGFFEGKKVVLVDDSIVRGSTMRKLVSMIRRAGAKEIHIRIGSPPVAHPCFYGIDTPTKEELVINQISQDDLSRHLGADSLTYLSLRDLMKIPKNEEAFCTACFSGEYPLGIKERVIPVSTRGDASP
ncbi:amidophosphoribosyltransferase [bacterium]|nr:amidophosphoribosyltransferase [bacterium]